MKKYKLSFSYFIIVFCSVFMFHSYVKADFEDVVVNLQINNPMMEVNGLVSEVDTGRRTTPVIINGRTLVPIRAIVESFGGSVSWDGAKRAVSLSVDNKTIVLAIDSYTAYLNGKEYTLDVAPAIINGRTMLPIRFVAEGLNLGVAWDAQSQRVTVIRNKLDSEEYNYLSSVIPQYSGYSYVTVNNNVPLFKNYEIIPGAFEYYSETDELGRCDVCMASVDASLMPTDSRESISSITPTGWINGTYDFIDGKYLYNRCHLIGYQLTGENANKSNLITGTRYMNVEGMLPFENMVDNYIEQTGNSVMYRVTPFFRDNNMVAEGVLLEAYSVEDSGRGISFCVYCYNVQPGVLIDYKTGNHQSVGLESSTAQTVPASVENQNKSVYRTPSGKRYHYDPECGGKNSYCIDIETALSAGLTPCQKCAK